MIPRVQIEIEIFMNYVSWPAMEDIERFWNWSIPASYSSYTIMVSGTKIKYIEYLGDGALQLKTTSKYWKWNMSATNSQS